MTTPETHRRAKWKRGSALINKVCALLASVALVSSGPGHAKQSPDSMQVRSAQESAALQPSPEMKKLSDAFTGDWIVRESFEVDATRHGMGRQGTASFRLGPGFSLIENYQSNGSAGELHFLAMLWWDQSARVYRLLTCANNDGCELRGTAQWQGNTLLNSWQEDVDGRQATFNDSFTDITPSGFRLVSEGSVSGKLIWRVVTKYSRSQKRKPQGK
jgi:hypothetical protein